MQNKYIIELSTDLGFGSYREVQVIFGYEIYRGAFRSHGAQRKPSQQNTNHWPYSLVGGSL